MTWGKAATMATLTALLTASLAACISTPPPATSGGPPIALPSELAVDAHVRNMSTTTANLYNVPLTGFGEDLGTALSQCATGDRPLDLRAHVEQPDRNHLAVTIELVDPNDGDRVVGRYEVEVEEAPPLIRYADDPTRSDVGARVGRRLCAEAFGSNPA